jgi:tryptophan-rich sensory protein
MPNWISPEIASFSVFVLLTIAAAVLGGQWGAGVWYKTLSKPAWTPPNWLFPIAWTILYLMIALAGWLIWNTSHENRTLLLTLWGAQLVLNATWSYLFFGRKEIGLALGEIVLLWLMILGFIIFAWNVSPRAAYLFIPYLVWVGYAGLLNASIWQRNPIRSN